MVSRSPGEEQVAVSDCFEVNPLSVLIREDETTPERPGKPEGSMMWVSKY